MAKDPRTSEFGFLDQLDIDSKPWTLAPCGDLLLIVGKSQTCKLLVSATVLSLASSVFRAMFDGPFKEGVELRNYQKTEKRVELSLPEDDPAGMWLLCSLLHFALAGDDSLLTGSANLLAMSIVSDKYDCNHALRAITTAIMNHTSVDSNIESLREIAMASYFFDCPKNFVRVTKFLILRDTADLASVPSTFTVDSRISGKPVQL